MSVMYPRWDPWSELSDLHSTMDRVFGTAFGDTGRQGAEGEKGRLTLSLPVNVTEDDTGYELQAPVPGNGPEDIEVTFTEGVLTIKVAGHEQPVQRKGYLRREFFLADSVRQLALAGEIDPERIEADVQNGLLTVRVPKSPSAQPRRIQIGSSAAEKARLVGSGTTS
jgi:HSP20 family protein